MVRVNVVVGHPGLESPEIQVTLPAVPRAGEYIRASDEELALAGVSVEHHDLWEIVAVVHEPTGPVDATVYVRAASVHEIFDEFGDGGTAPPS